MSEIEKQLESAWKAHQASKQTGISSGILRQEVERIAGYKVKRTIKGQPSEWNLMIDWLDYNYVFWRGYRVSYCPGFLEQCRLGRGDRYAQ